MKLPISTDLGLITDLPVSKMPVGAWNEFENWESRDGGMVTCKGTSLFGVSLSATPMFVHAVNTAADRFYVYANKTVLYALNATGTTTANISHPSLSYSATNDPVGWTAANINGYTVFSDGQNVAQSWLPALGNQATSLTAWPATVTTRCIRSANGFLFALQNTTSGVYNPSEIRWSDKAAIGSLPLSWDYTDPTNQAGINEIGERGDHVIECLPLGDSIIFYLRKSVWAATYVGGNDIFSFRRIFNDVGIHSRSCAVDIGGRHLVVTRDDVIIHDGNSWISIAEGKVKRVLLSSIVSRTVAFKDSKNKLVYILVATAGTNFPRRALVWNYAESKWHINSLGDQSYWFGISDDYQPGLVAGSTGYHEPRMGADPGASGARVLVRASSGSRFYHQGSITQMTSTAVRYGIAVDNVNIIRSDTAHVMASEVSASTSRTIELYLGWRDSIGQSVSASLVTTFLPTDYKCHFRGTGRYLDIKLVNKRSAAVGDGPSIERLDLIYYPVGRR